ncbi:MAG: esterase [Chloroflexota bacterium]
MSGNIIQTVSGDVPVESLGKWLPHEHLFTDLRGPLTPGYAQGDPAKVAAVLRPYLAEAEARGVTALVECSTLGVGRNIQVLRHLASITPIHIIAATGVYKEGFIPPDLLDLSAEALADLWIRDLTEGIDGTSSRAGFIKVALSDTGPTALEVRSLQAAARASRATGAVIASHTIGGAAARREIAILTEAGHDLHRFIWVHAHTEPDTQIHIEAAKQGVWLEFDAVGAVDWHPQDALLESVLALLEAGYAGNLLLSHDAGWYNPGEPDGIPKPSGFRGYTALFDDFIPKLKARGIGDATIQQLIVENPAAAYALTARQSR